ncbi:LON peptidase substrate-binding domain-containing protein [Roseomonas sp. 18066]|uniref:LON peptidase substrate-binding domain-containing protein n=1 Tax=Roseomonas sp. 18066 TaxID=2681412 RepID=UPI001359FF45|nr:LON peptidase substrate-binding domain-containing protein [Roseomonas sp. 18066]
MDPFQPRPDSLPAEVPVFPLTGALLLPGGRLPLNIFEPRYLAMVEAALAAGRLQAMVLPDPGFPRLGGRSTLQKVACLGRIASFSETEDGRYLVTLRGLLRFRVAAELPDDPAGFRRVRTDFSPYLADLAPVEAPALDRAALVAALRPYFLSRRIEADWAAIEQAAAPMLVTNLCMLCPFGDAEKQALLAAPDLPARAAMLVALLRLEAAGPTQGRAS